MLLQGHVALVTGASRGIGAATAQQLARNGARVGVNYLTNTEAANAVVKSIQEHGGHAIALKADARNREEVSSIVSRLTEEFGFIDTLVINASMSFPIQPFVEYPWEAFEAKVLGEMASAFHVCRAVVPQMMENKKGCIIAISSGLSRHPAEGFSAHSAAKSALDAFMKSLAQELGPYGIRVNVVAPGLTETDATSLLPAQAKQIAARMAPLRRLGQPEDVARAVVSLASPNSEYITGAYLPVSGGSLML
jgi:3-oxoacyl-[acyl-carrier protein] reductase